ncbi:TPA: DUF6236 family protein [Vibrio parahaemolyticus]|nr:DUF6236 family protein [uncultured Vibrio sp.]ELI5391858.1 hypothetical protein [Vibrio parahaemolyticus]ODX65767.1 hypothetical protein BBM09_07490 [Vibrio parahaemolyticus]
MERGIVTPAQEILSNGDSLSINGGLPPEKLRYMALYWDKIVITDSNIFGTGVSGDGLLLEQAKVLRKETARMSLNGTFNGSGLAKMHFDGLSQVATQLTQENPGQWAIHQSGDQLVIPKGLSKDLVTADFELSKCLPVPLPDYPIDKLIAFKSQRDNELQGLRQTLDELYLEISKSQDIPRSKIVQITRLENAIKDLDKVAKESWGTRLLASRKVALDINLGTIGQGVVSGGLVGSNFNSPLLGVIAGAGHSLLASMKFEVSSSSQLASSVGSQLDLSYLTSLKNEDIVR